MNSACFSILVISVASLALSGCQEPNAPGDRAMELAAASSAKDGAEAAKPPRYSVSDLCNIESIDGQPIGASAIGVAPDASIQVRGWLAAEKEKQISEPRLILAGENKSVVSERPVMLNVPRQDVAKVYASQGIGEMTGFEVEFPLKNVPAGTYHLYLSHRSGDELFACDNGRHIEIRG